MTKHARSSFLLTTLVAAMSVASVAAANVTNDDIRADATNNSQVVTNGMGLQGQRYSTLDMLNTENVSSLQPVWAFSLGGEKQRGQQSQPMIKDGVMYVTGSYSRVFAVDARTGAKLWQYDARLPDGIMPCCDVINRGVALWDNLVIFGTLDAKLVALDKDTGKVVWRKTVADYKAGYSITAAPLVVDGKLITGVSGGEFGVVGKIEAYNPSNGELLWTRPTIEGHMGYTYEDGKAVEAGISGGEANQSWPGDLWKTGGGAPWLGGYYDPETNLLFFGTGNPAPWNSHLRPGDNLYSSSRLASTRSPGPPVWMRMAVRSMPTTTVRAHRPNPATPAVRCSPRRPSSAARTGCRCPTVRTPACSTSRRTSGAWTSGTNPPPTRRAPPTWVPASPSSR